MIHADRRSKAFTLVELLVVIAIISVLAALLLPALEHARESARIIQCLSHQKQTFMAVRLYGEDYGEYPDMYKPGSEVLTAHGNHPDFPSGVVRKEPAVGMVHQYLGPSDKWPAWMDKVMEHSGEDLGPALKCNAPRGDFTRGGQAWLVAKTWAGYGNGTWSAAFAYWGPGVHWDDVNPQSVINNLPHGVKWISNAPWDTTTSLPANWDLRMHDETGVLFACPSPSYDGASWGGPNVPYKWGYGMYNTDFVIVRPHGIQRRQRNYLFIDGHAATYIQHAFEDLTLVNVSDTWTDSPNGYY